MSTAHAVRRPLSARWKASVAALAAIAVGAASAAAGESLDVTFEVQASPMTLTLGPSVTFDNPVVVGAANDPQSSSTTISFANPSSQPGDARIQVERTTAPDLKGLFLQFGVGEPGAGEVYTISEMDYRGTDAEERTLVSGIAPGTSVTGKSFQFVLAGSAHTHTAPGDVTSTFTFTIEQAPTDP